MNKIQDHGYGGSFSFTKKHSEDKAYENYVNMDHNRLFEESKLRIINSCSEWSIANKLCKSECW